MPGLWDIARLRAEVSDSAEIVARTSCQIAASVTLPPAVPRAIDREAASERFELKDKEETFIGIGWVWMVTSI